MPFNNVWNFYPDLPTNATDSGYRRINLFRTSGNANGAPLGRSDHANFIAATAFGFMRDGRGGGIHRAITAATSISVGFRLFAPDTL